WIWTERNKRLHDGVSQTPASLFKKIDRNVRDTILGKRKTALDMFLICNDLILQHLTCQSFGMNYKDLIAMIKKPKVWPSFATEPEKIEILQICFSDFKIIHIPQVQN
ncbi:hypothetical protein IGI04_037281, partial [Brassica rapa subsp. trilocularis]